MNQPIYLDYNATTPVAPEVVEAMIPALRDAWGNPSSAHAYGERARRALADARAQVAGLIGCDPEELIFTSGGTESDNAAIEGVANALAGRGRHIVISAIEHAAVAKACAHLEQRGWTVSQVGVDGDGKVDADEIGSAIKDDTVLISLMHANNETGVIQPVREVSAIARSRGIVFHTDAAQSVGKLPIDVNDLGADLLTIAGHKLYAPKGVGALYLRRGTPFEAFFKGAGHERGLRSGTENTPGIVGLGAACALAGAELAEREAHLREVRDRLEGRLRGQIEDLVVHGGNVERLPNTLSAAIPGVEAHRLLARATGVASAAGAACHSGKHEPSAVLRAMGVSDDLAVCTLRLTTGRNTTVDDADAAGDELGRGALALRSGQAR